MTKKKTEYVSEAVEDVCPNSKCRATGTENLDIVRAPYDYLGWECDGKQVSEDFRCLKCGTEFTQTYKVKFLGQNVDGDLPIHIPSSKKRR